MRSTAIQYVGIDVHQATLVCVVKDETGRTTIESKVATMVPSSNANPHLSTQAVYERLDGFPPGRMPGITCSPAFAAS